MKKRDLLKRVVALSISVILSISIVGAQVPQNIIFMIGDGMGLNHIYAAMTANYGKLNIERCSHIGFSKTYSANDYITDSAAGGTALACGVKTKNGMVGMSPDSTKLSSTLTRSGRIGKSTGIVVTSSVTHATPADFIANQDNRKKEEEIALDFMKSPIDVFIGGGLKFFNERKDGKDLTKELEKKGFRVATTMEEVKNVKRGKLAGLVAQEALPKANEGRGDMLSEATQKAIELLDKNKKGFFLMIEGSQIDWGSHANDASYTLAEMLDFDKTVGIVLDYAQKQGNTLVIITADHETGGLTIKDGDLKKGDVEVRFETIKHTGTLVPVFSFGPKAEEFIGIQENIDIPQKIIKMWNLEK